MKLCCSSIHYQELAYAERLQHCTTQGYGQQQVYAGMYVQEELEYLIMPPSIPLV